MHVRLFSVETALVVLMDCEGEASQRDGAAQQPQRPREHRTCGFGQV